MLKRTDCVKLCWILISVLLIPGLAIATPPSQWAARGTGAGGALYAPSISPFSEDEMYLACDMSELFHTTNRGLAWSTLDFHQFQGFHNTRVQFTSDPNTLYALNAVGGGYLPSKSTNAGASWQVLADPSNGNALWLVANPQSSAQFLMGSPGNLYVSNDGGNSMTSVYSDAAAGTRFSGAFFDGLNIYIGTNRGLLVSANGGSTFAFAAVGGIPAGESIASFAGAKQGSVTRFFIVTLKSFFAKPDTQGSANFAFKGVYTLDYGNANWIPVMTGIGTNDQPFFVGMSPGNISVAYLAGGTAVNPSVTSVYRTGNGGASWQSVFKNGNNAWSNQDVTTGWQGYGGSVNWWLSGAPALGFAVAPNDYNRIIVTDSGWAHLSTDGGASWSQVYVDPSTQNFEGWNTPAGKAYESVGLEPTATWWLTWADASHLISNMSDFVGTRSSDGGHTWAFDMAGLQPGSPTVATFQSVASPSGVVYAGTSTHSDIYQSLGLSDAQIGNGKGTVESSSDGGHIWQLVHDFGHPVVWVTLDPQNPNRMLASVVDSVVGGIYETLDLQDGAASQWVQLSAPQRTQGHPFNVYILNDETIVATYSGRINSSGSFTNSSGVFTSHDGGASWQDVSVPGMDYWTMNLTIDPSDATQNTWYVGVYTGWGGVPNGGLYKTQNRGATPFTKVFGPDTFSVTVNPSNTNELYVATSTRGLYYSSNNTSAAPTFSQLNYPFARPTRVFFNPYNAGEVWVTSFGNGLRVGMP